LFSFPFQKRTIFGQSWRHHNSDKLHKSHFERRLLRVSPENLFKVVLDVDKYQEFVPWVKDSKILQRDENKKCMEAELAVGFKLFEERYTSQVTWEESKSILVSVTSNNLFHYLHNSWEFAQGEQPNTCWTSFTVVFKFRSEIHRTITDIFFSEVQKRMLFAFEERCKILYPYQGTT